MRSASPLSSSNPSTRVTRPAASPSTFTLEVRKVAAILQLLLFRVPLLAIQFAVLPSSRPYPKWSFLQSLVFSTIKEEFRLTRPFGIYRGRIEKSKLPLKIAAGEATPVWIKPFEQSHLMGEMKSMFEAGKCNTKRFPAFWYGQDHAQAGKGSLEGEQVFLYFHGGGYIEQSASPSSLVAEIARILLAGAKGSSKTSVPRRLLAPEYRLTDETSFPGIMADALASWSYLVNECGFEPGNILISGDSAGGNLALALCRYLRNEPVPINSNLARLDKVAHSLILFSPWVDVSLSFFDAGSQSSAVRNQATDILSLDGLIAARDAVVFDLPEEAVKSVYLSCITFGQSCPTNAFDGFPRALLFYGGLEVFADQCQVLQEKYNKGKSDNDGECTMNAFEERSGTHDYYILPFFTQEKNRAIKRLSLWL